MAAFLLQWLQTGYMVMKVRCHSQQEGPCCKWNAWEAFLDQSGMVTLLPPTSKEYFAFY